MNNTKRPCTQGYGARSQGICPFDVPGASCRECRDSRELFDSPQNIPGANSVKSDCTNPVTGKKKSAFSAFAGRLKKRAFLFISRNNGSHKHSPLSPKITTEREQLELALTYLEDGAVFTAVSIIKEILGMETRRAG